MFYPMITTSKPKKHQLIILTPAKAFIVNSKYYKYDSGSLSTKTCPHCKMHQPIMKMPISIRYSTLNRALNLWNYAASVLIDKYMELLTLIFWPTVFPVSHKVPEMHMHQSRHKMGQDSHAVPTDIDLSEQIKTSQSDNKRYYVFETLGAMKRSLLQWIFLCTHFPGIHFCFMTILLLGTRRVSLNLRFVWSRFRTCAYFKQICIWAEVRAIHLLLWALVVSSFFFSSVVFAFKSRVDMNICFKEMNIAMH